ncbi:stimulated by retinoic acid gene 6 protein-like isoform X1 [Dreissena polymorpha]|uniref:stimulated by retinoic acid gene 6 protein-like isoform X1 n=1 Tax=Dreissena polymorpha TaxID=45954 RepID=UPI002263CFC1|nr:stimulated by retinoic acid gene 6 protein-like isoform X1 [Dreissena polymorpha]
MVKDSPWFLIPSVLILFLLGSLDKRRNVCKTFCDGRPGLPRPLSFLDEPRNTWGILFAFDSATTNILLVIQGSFVANFPIWAKVFIVYILSLVTSLICYPLFACMTSRHTLIGAITGLAYSAGWLAYQIYRLDLSIYCTKILTENSNINLPLERVLILQLPAVIFSTLVLVKFSWKLFKCVRKQRFTRSLSEEARRSICKSCDLQYVKALLIRTVDLNSDVRNASVPKKIYHYLLKPVSGFKFPITMMITTFVSILLVFIITLSLAFIATLFTTNTSTVDHINTAAVAIASILTIISGIRCVYVTLVNYRRDMLRLYRGDRSFIPESLRNMPPQTYVVLGMQFIGFSLIGSCLGSLLAFVVLYIPLYLTLLVLYLVDKLGKLHSLWPQFEWLIFPVSLLIISKVQVVLVNKIFMQNRINAHDAHRPLAINNRVVYDVFAFLMVFINASIGLVQVLKRIFVSVIYGVFLIARMDRSLLLSGYETMDACYTSYIGMILMDVSHNHPVMRVFCRMVHDTMASKTSLHTMVTENPTYARSKGSTHLGRSTTLAKRRWFLVYTLIQNPDIQKYRVKGRSSLAVRPEDVSLSEYHSQSTKNLVSNNLAIRAHCRKCSVPPTFATNLLIGCVLVCCVIWFAGMTVLWNNKGQLFVQLLFQLFSKLLAS